MGASCGASFFLGGGVASLLTMRGANFFIGGGGGCDGAELVFGGVASGCGGGGGGADSLSSILFPAGAVLLPAGGGGAAALVRVIVEPVDPVALVLAADVVSQELLLEDVGVEVAGVSSAEDDRTLSLLL